MRKIDFLGKLTICNTWLSNSEHSISASLKVLWLESFRIEYYKKYPIDLFWCCAFSFFFFVVQAWDPASRAFIPLWSGRNAINPASIRPSFSQGSVVCIICALPCSHSCTQFIFDQYAIKSLVPEAGLVFLWRLESSSEGHICFVKAPPRVSGWLTWGLKEN